MTKKPTQHRGGDYLDTPLIKFERDPADWVTIRELLQGLQIFGTVGSGKTSGSGQTVAHAVLGDGQGGCVFAAKVGEVERWLRYARDAGRLDDVIIFGPERPVQAGDEFAHLRNRGYRFNFLEYMLRTSDDPLSIVPNLVALFFALIQAGDRLTGGSGGGSDGPFWDRILKLVLQQSITLLILADKVWKEEYPDGGVSPYALTVANIEKVITGASMDRYKAEDPENALENWLTRSYTGQCFLQADVFRNGEDLKLRRIFGTVSRYFRVNYQNMTEKLKSSVQSTFDAFAGAFTGTLLEDLFSSPDLSNEIEPEMTFESKIILLDFPVKELLEIGIYAQMIFKKLFQTAAEKRVISPDTKVCFQWIDEAQFFLSDSDHLFQTTARESRICSILISQSINNYFARVGGQDPKARTYALLTNLGIKIAHANSDPETNQYMARVISQTYQSKVNFNAAETGKVSIQEDLRYQVLPYEFTVLRNGGPRNGYQVEGIMTVAGKIWSDGRNFKHVTFSQNPAHVLPKRKRS